MNNLSDDTSVKLKLEKQIKMILIISSSVILATNFINALVSRVVYLEDAHEYQIEADKRRLQHAINKQNYEWHILDLKKELKDCKDEKY